MREQARITVIGKVQGVSFRAFVRSEARRLGIKGFVRNLPNGDVEIVARGDGAALRNLISIASKGPSTAHVASVNVERLTPSELFENFEIRYD